MGYTNIEYSIFIKILNNTHALKLTHKGLNALTLSDQKYVKQRIILHM